MQEPKPTEKIGAWLKPALFFAVGLLLGWLAEQNFLAKAVGSRDFYPVRESKVYQFINPLLFYETPEVRGISEYQELKQKVKRAIDGSIGNGKAQQISVYFRDLTSGRWFGINQDERYTPASLLKVPTMIAILKVAEERPAVLAEKIFYDGSFDDNRLEAIKPLKAIEPGQSYAVDELIKFMIEDSDNNATRLLQEKIAPEVLREVYTDLGLSLPLLQNNVDFMSPKSYASFFCILYNATYLSREMSEKALRLLSKPDFSAGIRAGVPKNIMIANKFGERTVLNPDRSTAKKELHDCGIVYSPGHHYLVCIMTLGSDFEDLAGVIQSISSLIYKETQ